MASEPITWRNVIGPSLADASRPMEVAQRSFNNAFDRLGQVVQEREAINRANWLQGKSNNTDAAMAEIMSFATPEQFAQAQASGALQHTLTRNGAQVDGQALRQMLDGRLGKLQGQALAGINYGNAVVDQRTAPIRDRYKAAVLKNDPIAKAAAMAEFRQMGGRDEAELLGFDDQRKQVITDREREATKFGQSTELHNSRIATDQVQRQAATASILNASEERKSRTDERKYRQEDRALDNDLKLEKALGDANERIGAINSASISSKAGNKAVLDAIKETVKDPDELAGMLRNVSAAMSNPKYKDISATDFITAALSQNNPWYRFDTNRGQFINESLDALVSTPDTKEAALKRAMQEKLALEAADRIRNKINERLEKQRKP